MADFDPYANQGGAAAWDPDHPDDSRKLADKLLSTTHDEVEDDVDTDDDLESDLDGDPGLQFDEEYPETRNN